MGNSEITLKIDSKLNEFTIKGVLGSGTFGITYLAYDNYLDKQVVIKEYFPNDIAIRKADRSIFPKSDSSDETFEYGLDSFLKEAQTLAKFNHPNIVRVNSFCKSHNTAYFIMDYEEGEDLEVYLEKKPNLSEDEILAIILPLLDGLQEVHNKSYLHRDIKPGNIYLKSSGSPMLIDFGATRYSLGIKSQSLSIILTPGYAPKEQYSSKSAQAPATDIYAIGAVMYKMVTDATPIEASERSNDITDDRPDPHIKLAEMNYSNYSEGFKKAIDWAMEFKAKDRPQNVQELQDALTTKNNQITEEIKVEEEILEPQSIMKIEEKKGKGSLVVASLFLFLILGVGAFFFIQDKNESEDNYRESNYRIQQLEEENRRLEQKRRLAEKEAQRAKQDAKKEHNRLAIEQEQRRVALEAKRRRLAFEKEQKKLALEQAEREASRNIDLDKKKFLDIRNDGLNLTLSYPVNVKKGNRIYIRTSLKNNGSYSSRGGITLSFPQLSSIQGKVISNDFSTTIKTYGTRDKIWSKTEGSAIYANYLMLESNDEKWNQYEKHNFEVGIDSPRGIKRFTIQVRAALKKRVVPGSGIADQQGYVCKVITVNIID